MRTDIASIKLTCFKSDVYEPSDDSFLLVDTLADLAKTWPINWPRISLEVGCGTGYVICSLALTLQSLGHKAPHCFATDINPSAVSATLTTLSSHNAQSIPTLYVDILAADLFSPLHPRICGLVDLLVFNPPYVPTPDEEVSRGGIAASWAGGRRGRSVIDRLMPLVPELLSPTGKMVMIALDENDPQELIEMMEKKGFHGESVAQRAVDEEYLHVLHFQRKLTK